MEIKDKNIAMLIDADNVSHDSLKGIMEGTYKYGRISIRRIYGDWTSQKMKGWSKKLAEYSFLPMQKFADAKGKNSTDIALVIDAMDILYSKNVDCFCLVSSDSDFTGLARRIRENGLLVIGIGGEKANNSLINACDKFMTIDKFMAIENLDDKLKKPNSKAKSNSKIEAKSKSKIKEAKEIIDRAYKVLEEDDEYVSLNQLLNHIQKIDSSFSAKNYGFKNYIKIFDKLKNDYEYRRKDEENKASAVLIKKINND